MSWNYRVFKSIEHGEEIYSIRETYYNSKQEIYAFSKEYAIAWSESEEGLKKVHGMIGTAFSKPILDTDMVLASMEVEE